MTPPNESTPKFYTREEVIQIANLQQKESNLQLLWWFIKLLNTGSTMGMVRVLVHNKIVEIKGEGERA